MQERLETIQVINPLPSFATANEYHAVTASDVELLRKIKMITNRGNDAEIKSLKNGELAVYETKKKRI